MKLKRYTFTDLVDMKNIETLQLKPGAMEGPSFTAESKRKFLEDVYNAALELPEEVKDAPQLGYQTAFKPNRAKVRQSTRALNKLMRSQGDEKTPFAQINNAIERRKVG